MRIELPQVGESVTEGVIGQWLREVGDRVEKYDPLVEVTTDKVNMEVPSPASGVLTKIIALEGETIPMGAPIAEIDIDGEDPSPAPGSDTQHSSLADDRQGQPIDRTGILLKDVAPMGPTGSGSPDTSKTPDANHKISPGVPTRHSPAVKRLADTHGVNLSLVTGTGMSGRVTRKDVLAYIEDSSSIPATYKNNESQSESADGDERVPITPIRRIIADNMKKSATLIPQAWTIVEVDVTNLVSLRDSIKTEFQRKLDANLSYLPFIISAVVESLSEHPLLNSTWDEDAIIIKRAINIGVAVATHLGLMVPVLHNATSLSIVEIAKTLDSITSKAREGKLNLEDVQGGTFTINNTGVLGSVISKPLVNFPQAAIMSTEAIVKRPVISNDAIAIRSMMNLCLTFDHRIMDGSEASAFIATVKSNLEQIDPKADIF